MSIYRIISKASGAERYQSKSYSENDLLWEHQKNLESGCSANFNPEISPVLDIELLHDILHEDIVCSVRFSHDGKYVATGSKGVAQAFDVTTRQEICNFRLHDDNPVVDSNYVRSVCFSPDGRYLATAMEDKLIRTLVLQIEDAIASVAISPYAKYVAAGGLDNCIRIWDAATGDLVELFKGHNDNLYSITFASNANILRTLPLCATFIPDGKWILSGSKDKEIQFWNVETGEVAAHITRSQEFHYQCCGEPRGGCFASASGDRSMKIWSYKMI
ncbi:hypothetical protein SS1G_04956 [Sclerotinia sclerotiorum 1980 UF-70]|uniref:Uncharacterized protein n=1 Tax=Sclerotinia sclerotiorum (strain ATCC 18683 / 1980 / Ss-1) TaxID=665079 RepID=A7EI14_SCLS1|nr:hypothetical protein SS1G_04956 [Sclerotinia sclerotiorum 1980 UF-70]EDO02480.1 hypothetical protein SS1G_04956 [Sclerotinia sclerotiorum 1980 UF-70]